MLRSAPVVDVADLVDAGDRAVGSAGFLRQEIALDDELLSPQRLTTAGQDRQEANRRHNVAQAWPTCDAIAPLSRKQSRRP